MTDDVLISVEQGVGRIRLNRPKAIHALTTQMCETMSAALLQWMRDPAVELGDPMVNIRTGAAYLKTLQGQFGNDLENLGSVVITLDPGY